MQRFPNAILVAVVAATSACTKVADVFVCSADTQCRIEQAQGRCEPSGYCSFPANDCLSQFRYDRSADEAVAGQCVLEVDCDAPFTPAGDAIVTGSCVEGAPTAVDGDLSEWPDALFATRITHANALADGGVAFGTWSTDEAANDVDLSARVAVRWDARTLFVAAKIDDDVLAIESSVPIYDNDSFELFLDGLFLDRPSDPPGAYNLDDLQVLVRYGEPGPNGENGVKWEIARPGEGVIDSSGVSAAVGTTATGWTAEVAVKFSMLGDAPVLPGRTLGIDFITSDRESEAAAQPVERGLIWRKLAVDPSPCGECTNTCKPACSTQHLVPLQLGGR